MFCVAIVRYSVLTNAGARSWRIGQRHDAAGYRAALFAPARLDAHEFLFERLTLPSIARQTAGVSEDWFRLVVCTSTGLLEPYRGRLRDMLAVHPWARLYEVSPEERFEACTPVPALVEEMTRRPAVYATVRLDDDDALCDNFLEELRPYAMPEFAGMGISFARGYSAAFDEANGTLGPCFAEYLPKVALGLAMVHRYDPEAEPPCTDPPCVFGAGNHNQIDTKFPLIVDARRPAFLRTLHRRQDSFNPAKFEAAGRSEVPLSVVRERFTLSGWPPES